MFFHVPPFAGYVASLPSFQWPRAIALTKTILGSKDKKKARHPKTEHRAKFRRGCLKGARPLAALLR